MPPKKPAQPAANKKTQEKKKEKIIEDKTFGLKNKKGGKQQKFIKNVEHQVKSGGPPRTKADGKKTDKKKELDELNDLFKPVIAAQKVAAGVDPKSVLCAFFKQGQCTKGDKCKFSHDLTMERKCEKRSLYVDKRDDELEKDTMDGWDEKKLEEVVAHKHGESEKKKVKTNIRAALGANVTRITLETFLAWKKRKRQEKIEKAREQMEKKKADFKAGKSLTVSGREVFEFRPDLVDEDDDEADDTRYINEDDDEDENDMEE
ncbi:Zinc finger CCCH domain containing protein 15, partial [Dissostichus eleginoides]